MEGEGRDEGMVARVKVRAQVLGCTSCGLRAGCRSPVPFSGANPSPFVVVGEAPGAEEDANGRPFVGPAGRYLKLALDRAMASAETGEGRWSDTIAYLNAVSCYPGRTPTQEEVVACRTNLMSQMATLEPWYGLVVGGVAVSAFWPRIRVGDIRGRWWQEDGSWGRLGASEGKGRKVWLLATVHPSAVLRSGGSTSQIGRLFHQDVAAFAAVISSWKRPGLNVDCVKCGRGERKGMAEVWDRNIGACRKHEQAAFGIASSAVKKRAGGARARAKPSATSPRPRGSAVTPGILFG